MSTETGGPSPDEMGLPSTEEPQQPQDESKPPYEAPPGYAWVKKSDLPPDLRNLPPPITDLKEFLDQKRLEGWEPNYGPLVEIGRFTESGVEVFRPAAEKLVANATEQGLKFNKPNAEVVADFVAAMESLRVTIGDFNSNISGYNWDVAKDRLGVSLSRSNKNPPIKADSKETPSSEK